jgi:predicted phosphodiesterase
MRYALISDIHGNLPALTTTLAHIRELGDIDVIHHIGDLVGYGPWPNEVVKVVQDRAITGVAGNYDSTVAHHYKNCGCRYEDQQQERTAHESYEWTLRNVSDETIRFLRGLPFSIDVLPHGGHTRGPRFVLVHAHPSNNLIYVDESRSDVFLSKMADSAGLGSGDVIAFGHTHRPWYREVHGVHFVNTGSVGRPKDGDPRAGFAIVDFTDEGVKVEFVRIDYDVDSVASAILDSDLPHDFADFLRSGGKSRILRDA